MDLTEEQKKKVAVSIKALDRIQSDYENSFESYESAKVKGGFAAFISGMLFLGFVSGNYEIQQSIGTLGVGSLPIIFIGALVYFFNARNKYHGKISEHLKADQPLFDLGLSYTPVGRYFSEPSLNVIKTGEELNINDFV